MTPVYHISIDFLLIARCLLALLWGIFYALFLNYTHSGQQIASDVTWLSVVVGIGVDFVIAFNSTYWTLLAVVSFSSVGIITRSLYNESKGVSHPYIAIKFISDATANVGNIVRELQKEIDKGTELPSSVHKSIGLAYKAHDQLKEARRNMYAPGLARKQKE